MRRLVRVSVDDLLGRFHHAVDLPDDAEFTIIHGPNGVGKTRLLEIIAATFQLRPQALLAMPFQRTVFAFSDGSRLTLTKLVEESLPLEPEAVISLNVDQALQYRLELGAGSDVLWRVDAAIPPRTAGRVVREAERYLAIEQIGPELWMDQRTNEYLTLAEVAERYADELQLTTRSEEVPEQLRDFLASIPVHLIETQRLLTFDTARPTPRRRPSQRATVLQYAEDLTRRIRETLARNSRTSQELDRTFPRRVLAAAIPSRVTDDEIRERYRSQSDLRQRLAEIAVLDPSGEMPLPDKELENWERRVLWTYLEDSERKLSTFQTLLDRVSLLREVVNGRFLFKQLSIDADAGFRIISDLGEELNPSQLSSGEQHELVLLYDLLFNVEPNSLVLVDEPEISLHIGWQQQFLNDIREISALTDLRFLIATHSPHIIHTWWDRAVALYGDTPRFPVVEE